MMLLTGGRNIAIPAAHLVVLLIYSQLSDQSPSTLNNTTFHILLLNTSNEECHTNLTRFAVQQAICYLDTRHDIFPEFNIEQIEGQCGQTCILEDAQGVFFEELFKTPNEVAIIGPGCSVVSDALAELASHYHIPMVSLTSSYVSMTHSHTLSVLPSGFTLMDGVVNFVRSFPEWERIAIISQDAEMFRTMAVYLETTFSEDNMTVHSSIISRSKSFEGIKINKLFNSTKFRIVILNMDSDHTRAVLCKAIALMQYQFVWIIPGLYGSHWWSTEGSELQSVCDDHEMQRFLFIQRVILISPFQTNHTTDNLISCNDTAVTTDLFDVNMDIDRGDPLPNIGYQAYDAVLSIALGLNKTITLNSSRILEDINGSPGNIRRAGNVLLKNIAESSFRGLTGHVCFKDHERVVSTLNILQYKQGDCNTTAVLKDVGYIRVPLGGIQFVSNITRESLWSDGIPSDGSPITEEKYPILALCLVSYLLAGFDIIMAIVCILFTIIFKKKRVIRLSSPNLNYVIGIGVIVFCSTVFFFTYPPISGNVINTFCWFRSWFAAIGFSLCLGTINTKMWRVYYIFRNPKLTSKKKPLKDWHLFLFVSAFVLVDIVILVVATILPTARLEAVHVRDHEHEAGEVNADGIEVKYNVTLCESQHKLPWLGVLFGYKIIIQIIGVFLAFKIRKVKVKVLNDSKEVSLILYMSSIILAAVIIVTIGFSSRLNVYTAAYSLGIPITCTVILGVVFISKAIQLWKDLEGENIFAYGPDEPGKTATGALATCDELSKVAMLERTVKHLQTQLTFANQDICSTEEVSDNGQLQVTMN